MPEPKKDPETTDFNELWEDDDIPDEEGDDDTQSSEAGDDDEDDEPGEEDEDDEDVEEEDDDEEDDDEEEETDLEKDLREAKVKAKKTKDEEDAAAAAAPKTWKIPIDGTDHEVTEEQLTKGYATAVSSSQRFQEGKQMREEAGAFYKQFTGDSAGDALVDHFTHKMGSRTKAREHVRDLFLEWLAPDLEGALIEDPQERKIHDERRTLADERTELENRQKADKAKTEKAAKTAFVEDLERAIVAGLEEAKLPNKKEVWRRVTAMIDNSLNGGTDRAAVVLEVPAFLKAIATERGTQAKDLIKTLSGAQIAEMFPDQATALAKTAKSERVATLKKKRSKKKSGVAGKKKRQKAGEKWVEMHDAFE